MCRNWRQRAEDKVRDILAAAQPEHGQELLLVSGFYEQVAGSAYLHGGIGSERRVFLAGNAVVPAGGDQLGIVQGVTSGV